MQNVEIYLSADGGAESLFRTMTPSDLQQVQQDFQEDPSKFHLQTLLLLVLTTEELV